MLIRLILLADLNLRKSYSFSSSCLAGSMTVFSYMLSLHFSDMMIYAGSQLNLMISFLVLLSTFHFLLMYQKVYSAGLNSMPSANFSAAG